jgi:hypothetical protein
MSLRDVGWLSNRPHGVISQQTEPFITTAVRTSNSSSIYCHVSGVPWLIITGSGLDDWIYCALYTHTVRDYKQLQRYRWFSYLLPTTELNSHAGLLCCMPLYSHSLRSLVPKSKLCYNRRSVGQSVLMSSTRLGLKIRSLLLSGSCRLVDVGRSLWREDGSVVCQSHSQQ